MFIAAMIGLGTFILWILNLLPCRECRHIQKAIENSVKRELANARANPRPRSEMMPIGEWMDVVTKQYMEKNKGV